MFHTLVSGNVQLYIMRRMSQVLLTNMNIFFIHEGIIGNLISKFDKPIITAEI